MSDKWWGIVSLIDGYRVGVTCPVKPALDQDIELLDPDGEPDHVLEEGTFIILDDPMTADQLDAWLGFEDTAT